MNMEIDIPALPVAITVLLGFFAPYAIGALNALLPFVTQPVHRQALSIAAGVALGVLVAVIYIAATGDAPGEWWEWVLFGFVVLSASVGVIQGSYHLATGKGASALEARLDESARE